MWGYLGLVAAAAGLKGLQYLLEHDISHFWDGAPPRDRILTELEIPRVEEGSPVPLFFGTVRVRSPILAWVGNLRADATNIQGVTVDHWTGNFLYVIGTPLPSDIVRLREFFIGDSRVSRADNPDGQFPIQSTTGNQGGTATVSDETFLGGPLRGGGIKGTIEFRGGNNPAQTLVGSAHEAQWKAYSMEPLDPTGALLPGYRGQAVVALSNWRFGESPRMGAYQFEVYADCRGAAIGGYAPVGADANPMAVLRALITNPYVGLGYASTVIHTASFDAVAATLATEFHGISGVVTTREEGLGLIRSILDQTECAMYRDRTDGKFHVKLVRNDYDVSTIPQLDASTVEVIDSWDQNGYQDSPNEVVVRYTSRLDGYVQAVHPAQNNANITMNGGRVRSVTRAYPWCTWQPLAAILAARDLAALSVPLFRTQLAVSAFHYKLNPGDAVKWVWPDFGYSPYVVCRVVAVEQGTLTDDRVIVTLMLDRFGIGYGLFENPPDFGFPATAFPPGPAVYQALQEVPLNVLIFAMFNQHAPNSSNGRLLHLVGANFKSNDDAFHAEVDDGQTTMYELGNRTLCPTASVETSYARTIDPYDTVTGLRISNLSLAPVPPLTTATASDIRTKGRNLVYVGGEFLAFESATDLGGGTWKLNNVWRGLCDTAPVDHAVGDLVYFLNDGTEVGLGRHVGNTVWEGRVGETALVRLVPAALGVEMPGNRARQVSVGPIKNRKLLPLPVADLTANSAKSIASLAEDGVTFAWKRRAGSNALVRGDEAAMLVPTSFTYRPVGKKRGVEQQLLTTDLASTADGSSIVPLGASGHGQVDAAVRSVGVITVVDTPATFLGWQDPAVSVFAERWRNLLLNPRFATGDLTGWTTVSGSPAVGSTGATALGGAGKYLEGSGAAAYSIEQKRSIAGYVGLGTTGLSIVCGFYGRSFAGGGGGDALTVKLELLNNADAAVATATYGPTAQSATLWLYNELTLALVSTATKFRVTVSGTGSPVQCKCAELHVRVGQFSAQLVANGSFETGLTSWTTAQGSWRTGLVAANLYENSVYIGGGTAATDELTQDLTVPAGYEADATAVVEAGTTRDGSDTDDTGEIVVEARDAGGVLTSVTTGTYTPATNLVWERKRVVVDLPVGTTTVRVRLFARRVTDAGDANICFDDVTCRIHKTLDRNFADEQAPSFLAPKVQPLPQTMEEFVYSYPAMAHYPSYAVWGGTSPVGTRGTEPPMEDAGIAYSTRFMGPWNGSTCLYDAFRFTGGTGGPDLSSVGDSTFANFSGTASFWVFAWVRVDARAHAATAREILGRKGTARGWELTLTTTGAVVAKIYGASGNVTATSAATIADGRPHLIGLRYTAATKLAVFVDGAITETSSSGFGDLSTPPSEATWFRIGRSHIGNNGFIGQLAAVGIYSAGGAGGSVVPSDAELTALWVHGGDPNTGAAASAVSGGNPGAVVVPDGASGSVPIGLLRLPAGAHPIAWDAVSNLWGLALSSQCVNLSPSMDFASGSWTTVGSPTWLTSGVEDVEGFVYGARLTGDNTKYAVLSNVVLGATSRAQAVFFARATSGTPTIKVEVADMTPTVQGSQTFALTTAWKRIDVDVDWSAHGTTNGQYRVYASNTGSAATIEIASFVAHASSGKVPIVVPYEGQATVGDQQITMSAAMPATFNYGGEIRVVGRCTIDGALGTLVDIKNGSNDNNRRILFLGSGTEARLTHYDASATAVTSEKSNGASVLNAEWKIEGRWSRASMVEGPTTDFAGVELNDVRDYDRTAAFTANTTAPTGAKLGLTGDQPNVFARSALICHREVLP